MARLKKNRILSKKELLIVVERLTNEKPTGNTADELFTTLIDEIKKPPPPPPPG
jgi:hypothetical protein